MRRTYLPVSAAFVAGCLVAVLLAVSPASALSCNNCVDGSDVVNESLGSSDLATNSVRSSEITDGQVYGTDLANGAVGELDLNPNAKAAVGVVQLTNSGGIATANTGTFDFFTVQVPATGQLLVRVEGSSYVNVDAPTGAAVVDNGTIALCTVAASVSTADCGEAYYQHYTQDADNTDGTNEVYGFSLARVFNNVTAGPRTFYLNGFAGNNTLFLYGGSTSTGATASAQFFPSMMVVTS